MNKDQFISYLTNPSKLNPSTLEALDTLIKDFPYFQSARILYALNLFKENNIHYNAELKTTAIYAGNRNILKKHIDRVARATTEPVVEPKPETPPEQEPKVPEASTPAKTEAEENRQTPIEYETPDETVTSEKKPSAEKSTEEDTIAQLKKIIEQRIREIEEEKKLKGEEKTAKPLSKKSKLNLIDEFIHNQPSISRTKGKFYDPVDKARESIVEQEDIVSETLATIYMDQGYYEKAINMYEKLILKIPEKSSYFAALIKKANKALKNKK